MVDTMTFLGLTLNAGLSAAFAVSLVSVFWHFSDLPDINWNTIASGVLALVSGAAFQVFASDAALGVFYAATWVDYVVGLLYLVGGLLVFAGTVVQSYQLLTERWG